ncbi:DUF2617 family protein [Streptomyces malaysiensis]|uniref:DUF2617 family protein n=1 Tax=Streptomyces malaysiensis subsp. samsunensis TaxID=459658 RepID=A0A9X2LU52_STRMQ|nr:DUF2617 family protein [Streptomyces samsunensis]MCQ8829803.1 DUF2617 family protein [Streptomyces samsunensis]
MLTILKTAYTDTRAADLAWGLGREPLPALAVLDLQLHDFAVQLRLLGASHQVLLEGEGSRCSETVACMSGNSTPLPLGVSTLVDGREYEFAARVEELSQGAFAGRAQELLALVADHPHGLAGTFPGSPNAFTALLAQWHEGTVGWRTWHAYPQEGRLVTTRTCIGARVPAALRPPGAGGLDMGGLPNGLPNGPSGGMADGTSGGVSSQMPCV